MQLLSTRGGIDLDRWWALAELMREEGLSLEAQGDIEGAERAYTKSLRLALEVLAEVDEIPDYLNVSDLELVIDRMIDRPLAPGTRAELVGYLVTTGRFDKAENLILWAAEEAKVRRRSGRLTPSMSVSAALTMPNSKQAV